MKEFDKQIMHFLEDKRKVSIGSAWARGGATSQVVRVEDILPALVDVFRKAPEHPVLAVCLRMWGGHGQADYSYQILYHIRYQGGQSVARHRVGPSMLLEAHLGRPKSGDTRGFLGGF